MIKNKKSYPKNRLFDRSSIIAFLFVLSLGVASHLILFLAQPVKSERVLHSLSLGLSFDVMIASFFGFLSLFLSIIVRRFQKLFVGILVVPFSFFILTDYIYVQQFGTHLPFSTLEYLDQSASFTSNISSVLTSLSFWGFFGIPSILYILVAFKMDFSLPKNWGEKGKVFGITFLALVVLGGASGSYSNSDFTKNMNDALTSSALNYFFWSKRIEQVVQIKRPKKAIQVVQTYLKRNKSKKYPLLHQEKPSGCSSNRPTTIAQALCGVGKKPNILIILLESFRAAEVGVYGSKEKVTPHFDRWSKKGVLFENFYANGFQTRHGQVATYCSLMPNYGAAIMKRFWKNKFRCLPQILKERGYDTSWMYASNASFDNQIKFFPSIGFDQMFDHFSFPKGTEKLGWGFSDKAMYKKWIEVLDKKKEPFFSTTLTVTNHHPFDVPQKYKRNKGQDSLHKYYETMGYTDSTLNQFLKTIEKKPWYKNTLIFILADTSNYQVPQSPPKNFEQFVRIRTQIPMLILGGKVKPLVVKEYSSQIDIAPTVLDILGKPYKASFAGHSWLSPKNPFIAYTNRPGNYWAVMSQKGRYYNESNKKDHFVGFSSQSTKRFYKDLGLSWIDLTKWMLQENNYWNQKIKRNLGQ
ncbi:MAG: phosphoglycerol transferase MdoB-like AlkP superfamily enzyme [bacterium]|jgi:phosphoglycerol transferase MdoB-like AlkP superfamily enzyme